MDSPQQQTFKSELAQPNHHDAGLDDATEQKIVNETTSSDGDGRNSNNISSSSNRNNNNNCVFSGLSELSKQLRKLQVTNRNQAETIKRLERDLRIATELKGISVSDIRSALRDACQDEAHEELRWEVSSLRAALAAATHEETSSSSSSNHQKDIDSATKSKFFFVKEASSRAIATLELRVGELEEVEAALKDEVKHLYRRLRDETSRATQLESDCASLRADIENAPPKMKLHAEDVALLNSPSTDGKISELRRLKQSADNQLHLFEARASVVEEQMIAREREAKLRSQQYEVRFQVQEDTIKDLEQQLSSLYKAFEMMQQEHAVEDDRKAVLSSFLQDSDSKLAHQIHDSQVAFQMQVQKDSFEQDHGVRTSRSELMHSESEANIPRITSPPSFSVAAPLAPLRYSYHSQSSSSACSSPRDVTSFFTSPSDDLVGEQLVTGFLLKKTLGGTKTHLPAGWKKRYFILQGTSGNCYNLSYSDGPGLRIKNTFGPILYDVSSVTPTEQFPKQRFALTLHLNRFDIRARVVHMAASSKKDQQRWLSALTLATRGGGVGGHGNASLMSSSSTNEQEAADHLFALKAQQEFS